MQLKYIISILLVFLFAGTPHPLQAKSRYKAAGAKAKDIDTLYYLEPLSQMGYVYDNDHISRNDSFATVNIKMLNYVVHYYKEAIHLAGKIEVNAPGLTGRINEEIARLMTNAGNGIYLEQTGGRSIIDSVMDAEGKRFLLIIADQGFIRSKKNVIQNIRHQNLWQIPLRAPGCNFAGLVDGLTAKNLGEAYTTTGSNLFVMIIDARDNKTYYYNENRCQGGSFYNPLSVSELTEQFHTSFEGFYFSKRGLDRW